MSIGYKNISIALCLSIILVSIFIDGCIYRHNKSTKDGEILSIEGDIIVLGFKTAILKEGKSNIIQSPLSGNLVMSGTVSQGVTDRMTANLFARMPRDDSYHLVSPSQTMGIYTSIISSGDGQHEIDIYQKIGQAFSADLILTGYVYRWEEREGSDYSASRPASVSFDLYLIRTSDKAILWRRQFDKTQRSLSENIFDLGTFLKGKGKWMTADELANVGLEDILDDLFNIL
jgi:hypothetical protein